MNLSASTSTPSNQAEDAIRQLAKERGITESRLSDGRCETRCFGFIDLVGM
jgi:hypothetical protein